MFVNKIRCKTIKELSDLVLTGKEISFGYFTIQKETLYAESIHLGKIAIELTKRRKADFIGLKHTPDKPYFYTSNEEATLVKTDGEEEFKLLLVIVDYDISNTSIPIKIWDTGTITVLDFCYKAEDDSTHLRLKEMPLYIYLQFCHINITQTLYGESLIPYREQDYKITSIPKETQLDSIENFKSALSLFDTASNDVEIESTIAQIDKYGNLIEYARKGRYSYFDYSQVKRITLHNIQGPASYRLLKHETVGIGFKNLDRDCLWKAINQCSIAVLTDIEIVPEIHDTISCRTLILTPEQFNGHLGTQLTALLLAGDIQEVVILPNYFDANTSAYEYYTTEFDTRISFETSDYMNKLTPIRAVRLRGSLIKMKTTVVDDFELDFDQILLRNRVDLDSTDSGFILLQKCRSNTKVIEEVKETIKQGFGI